MINVKANESLKNVAKDALKGVQLLSDTVFFGINGAGKSTVCEILSRAATLEDHRDGVIDPLQVYAFDEKWRKENVGDFMEGGSARGITTVILDSKAGDIEKEIREAEAERQSAQKDRETKEISENKLNESLNEITDKVFHGVRAELGKICPSLEGRRFNRQTIKKLLEEGAERSTKLEPAQIDKNIEIANSNDPGYLPSLPQLPDSWNFSTELWQQVTEKPTIPQTGVTTISDWVRQGLELHNASDSCQFCAGTVTAQRIKDLEDAIRLAETEAPKLVKEQLQECTKTLSALRDFESTLKITDLSSSLYSSDLPLKKAAVLVEVRNVIGQMEVAEELLGKRVKNPLEPARGPQPNVDFSALQKEFGALENTHTEARDRIQSHFKHKDEAIAALKQHCCAHDGYSWEKIKEELESVQAAKKAASEAEEAIESKLAVLRKSISTTQHTANFLNDSLHLILGDKTLKVSEGKPGEGYRITRYDQRADGMSEGEKKLVSLLYFCAEFLSENRKQSMGNSVIIFDDLGSELDESRLLTVDRFITNHFKNSGIPKPASLVYFTHSHTYLKILQNRLADKAAPNSDKKPQAIFYEVYKDSFSKLIQSTRCRKWDDKAIRLTNEYWLSFYMLLKAFGRLQKGEAPDFSTGNFCRKVLEGFTEFRAPSSDKFGSRLHNLITKTKAPFSPALSSIVNNLSHTYLNKTGGVLSQNEIETALIQTLSLLWHIDCDHFDALTNKFLKKDEAREFKSALKKRIDTWEESQNDR